MTLYSHLFYASGASELAGERMQLARMLKCEAALAKAQAKAGIIPAGTAELIEACAQVEYLDVEKLKQDIKLGGNAAIPLVQQLTRIVKNNDVQASQYVHLGATSQDIIDTAFVLEVKEWIEYFEESFQNLARVIAEASRNHMHTLMMGRTLLQQAKPITLGLKLALYLDALMRQQARLRELQKRVLVVQLQGAVGSGSGYLSEEVQQAFADELGLTPHVSWQSQRDTVAEWAGFLANVSGFLGKIARDFSLLMQTEIGELLEGEAEGKGGSSAMPHKRNPVTCAAILANAQRVPFLSATIYSSMIQENERSAGLWHAEWETSSQLVALTAGSLEKTLDLIQNMEVDTGKMLDNLNMTQGLIFAENVALALAQKPLKPNPKKWMENACKVAMKEKKHLKQLLEELKAPLDNLDELFDPRLAVGNSVFTTQSILSTYEASLST